MMKHVVTGENELFFSILRDLPYFTPITNFYGLAVRSMDTQISKTVLLRDVSVAPSSYQHFLLTGSTTSESLSEGVIKLLPFGMFYASIYGSSGSTLADVDTSQTLWSGIIYSKE